MSRANAFHQVQGANVVFEQFRQINSKYFQHLKWSPPREVHYVTE